ncbi:MAG: DUF3810 domain-containing protein [Bacteroidota bacterium]
MKTAWFWIFLGLGSLLLRWAASFSPEFVEKFYSKGLYFAFRQLLDVLGFVPFPVIYLVLAWMIFKLVRGLIRLFSRRSGQAGSNVSWGTRLKDAGLGLGAFVGGTVFFFLILWGYNYARQPIETQIGIDPQPLSAEQLVAQLEKEKPKLIALRRQLGQDSVAIQATQLPDTLEAALRTSLQKVLNDFRYPNSYKPPIRLLKPKGILIRFQSLGTYFPWTGECNADAGLHPLELPHVIAHELGHGYGFGDEGTCNFLAYLACIQSDHPVLQYAGHFEYYATLLYNYRRYNPDAFDEWLRTMPPAIKADWNDIIVTHNQYPDIFPKLRRATYDAYLKAQGIEEGIKNYNRVLMLVDAWENREMDEDGN